MIRIKSIFTLFIFCLLSLSLFAQYGDQLANRGFENWTTREETSVSEPVHWHSGGTATGTWSGLVSSQIEQSLHPRPGSTGSKSVRLFPDRILGVTANGNITNGRMNAGSTSASGTGNYNYTQRSESAYNSPISQLPDSISIWVCFRSQSTTDQAYVKAVVHGNADYKLIANGTEEPADMHVATAYSLFTRTSTANGAYTWRRLSIPFQNNGPCTDVRYLLLAAATNKTPGSGSTDDDLYLDDILLVYNPTLTMGQLAYNIFYQGDPISIPFTLTGTMSPDNLNASANVVIAQMSDANGSFNNPTELGRVTTNTSGNIVAHIPNVTAGQYMVRVISTNYPMVGQNIQTISVINLTYIISATANPSEGGTVSGAGEYEEGASCTLTATANPGYTFTNWTENGNVVSTNASYIFNVVDSRNLVANFSLNTYSINATANPSAGGSVSGAGEYNHGQSCTLTASANTGYTFTNWTENGNVVSSDASYTFTVTGNRSLVANFTLDTYTITATANPTNGGTVSGAGEFNHGASCTLTATANSGYTFTNWTENGTVVSTNASYIFIVTGNHNLVANFTLNTYTITATANPNTGGTVSGAGVFNHGASCTLTATANTGYTFTNWTENGSVVSTNASYTFTVTGNHNLVANFTLNSYTITATANPNDGGIVSGAGEYNYGASCTLSATANEGHTFVNWTENGSQVSSQATYTFTVTGNRNLVAHFSSQSYIITATADPAEGGVVTGSGGYDFGDYCTLTATANDGYTFVNWTKDGAQVSTDPSFGFTVTESAAYVAHFSINTYMINVIAEPEEGGTVIGAGEYVYGASCTLEAIANEDYDFIGWTKDDEMISSEVSITFTVTASATYVAVFGFDDNVEEHVTNSQIFPHPFISKVSIMAEKDIKSVFVYDLYGHLLKEQSASGSQLDLDLGGLSAGVYLLQINYGDSRSVHRIMKSN